VVTKALMVLSSGIVLAIGIIHCVYTFWGSKLTPRDPAVQVAMGQTSLVLTKETTIWRCWVGFNASHSMGLILFGLIYGYLALAQSQLLYRSPFLLIVGLVTLIGFLALAKAYWFSIPLAGIGIALACYVASIVTSRA
jgi:hypothetical protein